VDIRFLFSFASVVASYRLDHLPQKGNFGVDQIGRPLGAKHAKVLLHANGFGSRENQEGKCI
jgi:hypothetical protein